MTTPSVYNLATHPDKLKNLRLPHNNLSYSVHAEERWLDKVSGIASKLHLDVTKGKVVEIEMTGTTLTKIVVRVQTKTEYDVVLVLRPQGKTLFRVLTVWINHRNDSHDTLNTNRITAA